MMAMHPYGSKPLNMVTFVGKAVHTQGFDVVIVLAKAMHPYGSKPFNFYQPGYNFLLEHQTTLVGAGGGFPPSCAS